MVGRPFTLDENLCLLDADGTVYTVSVEVMEHRFYPDCAVLYHNKEWLCVRYGEFDTWLNMRHVVAVSIRVDS